MLKKFVPFGADGRSISQDSQSFLYVIIDRKEDCNSFEVDLSEVIKHLKRDAKTRKRGGRRGNRSIKYPFRRLTPRFVVCDIRLSAGICSDSKSRLLRLYPKQVRRLLNEETPAGGRILAKGGKEIVISIRKKK